MTSVSERVPLLENRGPSGRTTALIQWAERMGTVFSRLRTLYVIHVALSFSFAIWVYPKSDGDGLLGARLIGYGLQYLAILPYIVVVHCGCQVGTTTGRIVKFVDFMSIISTVILVIIGLFGLNLWEPLSDDHDFPGNCSFFLVVDTILMMIFMVWNVAKFCCPDISLMPEPEQVRRPRNMVESLLRFKFRKITTNQTSIDEIEEVSRGYLDPCGTIDTSTSRFLSEADAKCCICQFNYEDSDEVVELPCRHHFHCNSANKWLNINPVCPICRRDVFEGSYDFDDVA